MSTISLLGKPVHTSGELPEIGEIAPDVELVKNDTTRVRLKDFFGTKLLLNIFPSLETGTCSTALRTFNKKATGLKNTKVLCISRDLPYAQARFCAAEGLKNVITLSDFDSREFGKKFQLELLDGLMQGLLSRVVIILDENGRITYRQQVAEIADEPDYQAALDALQKMK